MATATPDPASELRPTQHYARISVRMNVRVSTIDAETDPWTGKRFFRASEETCANVSQGGAYIVTRESIPRGRRVLLEFELSGGREVQALARVVWIQKKDGPSGEPQDFGIGFEFAGSSRDQRLELERFIVRSLRRRRLTSETGHYTPKQVTTG